MFNCAELKPNFFKPVKSHLIKATHPLERLNLDFKGPLPSKSGNTYILTIDEYSRYPFTFDSSNIDTSTVITCLDQLFAIFGMPNYIHSDRGSSFMSKELKSYLSDLGIATSRTTSYNPQGNGQCERYNGIIWKTIELALRSQNLPILHWEVVMADALHSIRSLLCTATNETPHERMFSHQRRSCSGPSIPSWLTQPGKVYLKRHVKRSKYEPDVDLVDLLEANSHYAHVRLPSGLETTVSTRHLAPTGGHSEIPAINDENSRTIDNTDESIELGVSVESEQCNRRTNSSEDASSTNDTVCDRSMISPRRST